MTSPATIPLPTTAVNEDTVRCGDLPCYETCPIFRRMGDECVTVIDYFEALPARFLKSSNDIPRS